MNLAKQVLPRWPIDLMKKKRHGFSILVVCLFSFTAHEALAFYNPETGRWLNRDPIEEKGGPNVYNFVANSSIAFIDPFGEDFIAVADRRVDTALNPGLWYHYSIEYWLSCDDIELLKEYEASEWTKKPGVRRIHSVELLRDNTGWRVWQQEEQQWKIKAVSVSVIQFDENSGNNLAAIFKGRPSEVRQNWRRVVDLAKAYRFAEQSGFNGNFQNWPNSKYQMPGDDPFNNSNTFVRDVVQRAGFVMKELKGSHPGLNTPVAVPDVYGGTRPFKGPPPQPPTP